MKDIFKNKKNLIIGLIVLAVVVGIFYLNSGEGRFVRTGDMVIPRFAHSAVLLNDGKVLITGGYSYSKTHLNKEYSKSAEIYNPATGKFTRISDMNFPRGCHSTILLNDGRVLIVGGGPKQAEIYDTETGKFSVTGSMPIKFFNAIGEQTSIIKLKNGRIFIIDGIFKDRVTYIIEYMPQSKRFKLLRKTNFDHDSHNAILLPNGNILIIGGYQPQKAEIYNPATNEVKFTNNENDIFGDFMEELLNNNKVILIKKYKNQNVNLFDFESNTFTTSKADKNWNCKGDCTATLLNKGKVLIVGVDGNKQKLYDPKNDKFIDTKSVELNDFYHTATLLQNGDVLITGGMELRTITTSSNMALLYKN